MHANDVVEAYEDGLITEGEALEQCMVDRMSDVYRKAHEESSGRGSRHGGHSADGRGRAEWAQAH